MLLFKIVERVVVSLAWRRGKISGVFRKSLHGTAAKMVCAQYAREGGKKKQSGWWHPCSITFAFLRVLPSCTVYVKRLDNENWETVAIDFPGPLRILTRATF